MVDAGVPLRQLTDHGTHEAVYVSDPDGNDLELAWDRPPDQWPRFGGDDAAGVQLAAGPRRPARRGPLAPGYAASAHASGSGSAAWAAAFSGASTTTRPTTMAARTSPAAIQKATW